MMPSRSLLELMGLAGILVFFAGLHQLWLAREEIFFWLQRFVRIFTSTLRTAEASNAPEGPQAPPHKPELRTLHLVGGLGLMALGSFLVLASLAMMYFTRGT
jgi:hypothetical protein